MSDKIVPGAVQPSCHLATVPGTSIPVQNIPRRGNVRIERGNCAEKSRDKKNWHPLNHPLSDGMLTTRISSYKKRSNLLSEQLIATIAEQLLTPEDSIETAVADSQLPEQASPPDDETLEEEIEDELIIEDFTIDGICGVY
ncbi:MAG TPA: mycofactocin precursor MftA [Ktedonobacteraceae bacterium]|nr:mycofactocin precursor MftA [Ktedonobacteraceae bacterium]